MISFHACQTTTSFHPYSYRRPFCIYRLSLSPIPPINSFPLLLFPATRPLSQCLLSLQHLHVLLFVATLDYDAITRLNPTMTQRSSFTRHPMYPLSSLPNSSHCLLLGYVSNDTSYVQSLSLIALQISSVSTPAVMYFWESPAGKSWCGRVSTNKRYLFIRQHFSSTSKWNKFNYVPWW